MEMKKSVRLALQMIAIAVLILPSLITTLYAYPAQDDFHYAFYARELMNQEKSVFEAAWIKTVEYYQTFCGCYTSSFLGYFFSGIINCSYTGIQIYELLSGIFFYIALYTCTTMIARTMLNISKTDGIWLYLLMLLCVNGLIYYIEQEDFYWFITSVQYLTIVSMILYGIASFLCMLASEKHKVQWAITSSILGFLGSGGALNIAAFCCILYLLVTCWAVGVRRQKGMPMLIMGVTLAGAVINGLAPGNYVRAGGGKGIGQVLDAMELSILYACNRLTGLIKNPIFLLVFLLVLLICLKSPNNRTHSYRFYMPITFTFIMFGFAAVVIFPVMLGYGWDTYQIICRSNFISDLAIYIFMFLAVFYWTGWLKQEQNVQLVAKTFRIVPVLAGVLVICLFWKGSQVPFLRQITELCSGQYEEYSQYCVNLYESIAKESGDRVTIQITEVSDDTCLINPQIYIGYYDPDTEYCNQTIARFYGKEAVYYVTED